MRNVLRPGSSAETASASVSSPIVSRRRFLLQSSLAALLCSQIPGDQKTEKREVPELLTCKRILELLEAHGIDGARTVNTVLRPNDPAHVFLHIPQRHAITFMSPENQRAVRASQADIERMILDMHVRLGVREVFPENMVPCNLRDREEFVASGDREKDLLESITFQRKLLEDSNKHPGDP